MRQHNTSVACALSCLLVLNVFARSALVKHRATSCGDTAVLESIDVGFAPTQLASATGVFSGQKKLLSSADSAPNITSAVDGYLLRYGQATLEEQRAALQQLLQEFSTQMVNVAQIILEVQVDVTWAAVALQLAAQQYMTVDHPVVVDIDPTPSFYTPQQISIGDSLFPSARLDGRITDVDYSLRSSNDMPTTTLPLLLFYRTDVFTRLGLQVPDTWQQLISVAKILNGTSWGAQGNSSSSGSSSSGSSSSNSTSHKYSMCFNPTRSCARVAYMLQSIFASFVQQAGLQPGFLMDPSNLALLVDTPAMVAALEVYQQLLPYNNPAAADSCYRGDLLFSEGQCAMTINFEQFRDTAAYATQEVKGNVGAAQLPGSLEVLDRASGQLAPCGSWTYAEAVTTRASTTPASAAGLTAQQSGQQQQQQYVNRAGITADLGFMPQMSDSASLSSQAELVRFSIAVASSEQDFLAHVAGQVPVATWSAITTDMANSSAQSAAQNGTAADQAANTTLRRRLMNERSLTQSTASTSSNSSTTSWDNEWFLSHGYALADLQAYVAAHDLAAAHPNRALDLQINGFSYFRLVFAEAAENVTAATGLDGIRNVTATMAAKCAMVLTRVGNLEQYKKVYQRQIGYTEIFTATVHGLFRNQTTATTAFVDILAGKSKDPAALVATVVTPTAVGLTLLAVAVAVWAVRRGAGSLRLLGGVKAPGLGDGTTLVVTDIQNSTVLWEHFPAEVMDLALKLHHTAIRSALAANMGYESATEGDSFIVAFHNANDSLRFCLDAQTRLLEAAWPEELLQGHEESRPVLMSAAMPGTTQASLSAATARLQGLNGRPSLPAVKMFCRTATPPGAVPTAAGSSPPSKSWFSFFGASRRQPSRSMTMGRPTTDELGHSLHGDAAVDDFGVVDGAAESTTVVSSKLPWNLGSDAPSSCTFGWALSQAWQQTPPGADPLKGKCKVVFRGLRVRMGLHSGLADAACWGRDKGSGRIHYSGEFLNTAKHVGDAAHGGMLMLSEATLGQLHLVDFESTAAIFAMGEHLLVSDDAHSTRLFQAVPLALASRLAHFQPPRTAKVLSQSVLAAPVGFISVAFVNAVGVQSLMAWDADMAQEALDLYQSIAGKAVVACSGYVVETSGGLCLATFPHAGLAVACCVKLQGELTAAEWAPELLKHELCEDICILAPSEASGSSRKLRSRGLRIKAGIDVGGAADSLHGATGQMGYRGRLMNRAARVATLASTSQVLCSKAAWEQAKNHEAVARAEVAAAPAGVHHLKGVLGKMEVFHCTSASATVTAANPDVLPNLPLAAGIAPVHRFTFSPLQLSVSEGDEEEVDFQLVAGRTPQAPAPEGATGTTTACSSGGSGHEPGTGQAPPHNTGCLGGDGLGSRPIMIMMETSTQTDWSGSLSAPAKAGASCQQDDSRSLLPCSRPEPCAATLTSDGDGSA